MYFEWKREWSVPLGVGIGIGFGIGYGLCYWRNKKNQELRAEIRIIKRDEETIQSGPIVTSGDNEQFYPGVENLQQELSLEEVQELEQFEYDPETHTMTKLDPEPETTSVFQREEDIGWDMEEELKNRTPDTPYVIHRDEYYEEEPYYSHSTLTYYQGDDVLVDELDVPIYEPKIIVGELIFGKGSGDPSVVHIRNDKLEAEYEVLLDHGFYQVEILGQEIEHQYDSKKPPLYKFRD